MSEPFKELSNLTPEILLVSRNLCRAAGLDPDYIADETRRYFIDKAARLLSTGEAS